MTSTLRPLTIFQTIQGSNLFKRAGITAEVLQQQLFSILSIWEQILKLVEDSERVRLVTARLFHILSHVEVVQNGRLLYAIKAVLGLAPSDVFVSHLIRLINEDAVTLTSLQRPLRCNALRCSTLATLFCVAE